MIQRVQPIAAITGIHGTMPHAGSKKQEQGKKKKPDQRTFKEYLKRETEYIRGRGYLI